MVKDYNIYRFEKILVGKISVDTAVKGWLDDALRAQNLIPQHLADKATHGDYNAETGNFIVGDPSYRPEMPIVYAEEDRRPKWSLSENSVSVWMEDDATVSCPDHETLEAAFRRLFKKDMPKPTDIWDEGDAVFRLLPEALVVVASYPGNSAIRRLKVKGETSP